MAETNAEPESDIMHVPRYCLSEIILYDNETKTEHVLGGGFNSDSILIIENELVRAVNKVGKL